MRVLARLNGDGCDWQCRLGDGDPPPAPEPDVTAYAASGTPIEVAGAVPRSVAWERLPLTWNGSEFATVFHEAGDDGHTCRIRFRRFRTTGTAVPPDWTCGVAESGPGTELVWTGSGYGLFYVARDWGIFYLRLDPDGKPAGDPVLVEPDPTCLMPAADRSGDGFILGWFSSMGGGTCGDWGLPASSSRVRFVGPGGETSGAPVVIEAFAGGPPEVATGDAGFGVLAYVNNSPELPSCASRFIYLGPDLSVRNQSGVLSDSPGGDVKWVDGRYAVAWGHCDTSAGGDSEACVAWFDETGEMIAPPVCNLVTPAMGTYPVRIAAGDRGLALVSYRESESHLDESEFVFLRTDLRGVAIGSPAVLPTGADTPVGGAYNMVWADTGFGLVHGVGWASPTMELQFFTATD